MSATAILGAMVQLRHDPITGRWRWLCRCGAGTGVSTSGDVDDRTPIAVARRNQWGTYADAVIGRIGHPMVHR